MKSVSLLEFLVPFENVPYSKEALLGNRQIIRHSNIFAFECPSLSNTDSFIVSMNLASSLHISSLSSNMFSLKSC